MSLLGRVIGRLLGRGRPAASPGPGPVRARYDNSLTTPENERLWTAVDYLSAKAAHDLRTRRQLRTRSRYETSNNPFLFGVACNNADDLIGTGPTLQVRTRNGPFNRLVERLWTDWAAEVDLSEKLRTLKLARTVDGEGFLVLKSAETLESPVKLYPVDVEADQVTTTGTVADLSRQWIDGMELDPVTGRPAVYHVLKHHPGDWFFPGFNPLATERVGARWVIHWFPKFRPGQVRGVPVFTPSLDLFAELRAFRKAVLKSAEIAADFAVTLQSEYPPGEDDDTEYQPFERVPIDRGLMTVLPHGMSPTKLDAGQPSTTYEMFQEKCLAEAVRPLAYPLNLALGTSQKFNFSSAKLDHINYRASLRTERAECERVALSRLFAAWWEEAVLAGAVPTYDGLRPPPAEWQWPGWEPIDPVSDAQADHERLSNGTDTLRDFWARRGREWQQVLAQQAAEQEEVRRLGLQFGQPATKNVTQDADTPAAAKAARVRAADWKEDDHPRGDDGKFGSGGSGDGGKADDGAGKDRPADPAHEAHAKKRQQIEDRQSREHREHEAAGAAARDQIETRHQRETAEAEARQRQERADRNREVTKARSREDKETEKAREKEDKATEKAREREDAKREQARESREEDIAEVAEAAREKEDKATEKAREKEQAQLEKRQDREYDALEKKHEKEDTDEDTANRERAEMADRHTQETDDLWTRHQREDEETQARRDAEDKEAEKAAAERAAADDREDAEVEAARAREDEEREAARAREDEETEERRQAEDDEAEDRWTAEDEEREARHQRELDEHDAAHDRRADEIADRHQRELDEHDALAPKAEAARRRSHAHA